VVADRRRELLAVRERDDEAEQLEVALLDDDRQLGELALVATDRDRVAIDASIDRALTLR
jgi:hypothetical protein